MQWECAWERACPLRAGRQVLYCGAVPWLAGAWQAVGHTLQVQVAALLCSQ